MLQDTLWRVLTPKGHHPRTGNPTRASLSFGGGAGIVSLGNRYPVEATCKDKKEHSCIQVNSLKNSPTNPP